VEFIEPLPLFVLIVAALGWLFDCLDQQLFNIARVPAMKALLKTRRGSGPLRWLCHLDLPHRLGHRRLTFGVLGDRIGRVKTMVWTILIYSICTG